MKARATRILATVVLTLALWSTARAELVTPEEAWTAAENYLEVIINKKGDWGGSPQAHLAEMCEFRNGDRVLGYFFHVKPRGFILTSLHKELSPIKAYSAASNLDPSSEEGMVDLFKGRMAHTLAGVERQIGRSADEATRDDWDLVIGTDYRPAWDELTDDDFDATGYQPRGTSQAVGMDYQEGEALLTSYWSQGPPYNDQCPIPTVQISEPPYWAYVPCDNTSNGRTVVGCVATAGVQILRYWNWPPCNAAGEYIDAYTWTNMPDVVYTNSPQDQIDCVAAASRSVGVSVGMDYGCSDGSSAYTHDMEGVFQRRRYHGNCHVKYREDYAAILWYELLQGEFNKNRPVQYRVERHSIVGDGWQIIDVGGVPTKQYHMNYGWSNSYNAWYDLDDLHLGGVSEEYIVRTIYPENAMGFNLYGHHPTEWESINHFDKPTRYLDQDASAVYAEFDAGQAFQYLRPGLHILHLAPYSDTAFIKFNGAPGAVTEFYHGAPFGDTKIRIADGMIKFSNGGEMVLH